MVNGKRRGEGRAWRVGPQHLLADRGGKQFPGKEKWVRGGIKRGGEVYFSCGRGKKRLINFCDIG